MQNKLLREKLNPALELQMRSRVLLLVLTKILKYYITLAYSSEISTVLATNSYYNSYLITFKDPISHGL